MVSVIQRIFNVQVSTRVRSYGRNENVLKFHMELKNMLLHNENELF